MLSTKLTPSCKNCVYYMHRPKDVPRCTFLKKTYDKQEFIEIYVARHDQYDLCGPQAIYFIQKKDNPAEN